MKNIRILILILLTTNLAIAQDYVFKVLANKGGNQLKLGETWRTIKTGDRINMEDEIKVAPNSYLGLVHSSGKPIELKEPKIYKTSELTSDLNTSASLERKYVDFILASNSAESKRNRLSASGAVHRNLSDIQLLIPENEITEVHQNKFIISWKSSIKKGSYQVFIKNLFNETLLTLNTNETFVIIDKQSSSLMEEESILVEVQSVGENMATSKQYTLKNISANTKEAIEQIISQIERPDSEEKAIDKIIVAAIYEDNKLFIDALTAYQKAIKLAPDVAAYQEAYQEFLIRNGL